MAFCSGEIDQTATCQQEDTAAVRHEEFLVVLADCSHRCCLSLQVSDFDFTVVVAGVAHNGSVFHVLKVTADNDIFHTGRGAKDVAEFGSLVHWHDAKAFHDSSESRKRVNFGDDNVGAHASGTHGNTAATMTVSGHDEGLARKQDARGPKYTVKCGLTGSVNVVKVPLCHGVVDGDHRVAKVASSRHGSQAMNARGRFFSSSDDAFSKFGFVSMDSNDEISAIVKCEGRFEFKRLVNGPVEVLGGLSMPSVDRVSLSRQPCCDTVVGRQGVAPRPRDFCTRCANGFNQYSCFLGDMEASSHTHASKRLCPLRFFFEFRQNWHAGTSPIHQKRPFICEPHVTNGVDFTFVQIIHESP